MLEAEGYQGALSDVLNESRKQRSRKKKVGVMLLEEILSKSNMEAAYTRVVGNKGSAGVDGVVFEEFLDQLKRDWPSVKTQLETDGYQPNAVKRVTIPKADGGKRHLGVPTYLDRLIQQAISQELTKLYDPTFSENSYGFRSEKNAHQALLKAKEYINAGYSHVVDLDLAQFFDRVNHDYLMNELSRSITDKRVLKLIHKILRAEVEEEGNRTSSKQGVPQGGPLSPLLSNIILDKLDKELERRGHRYIRYADDCSIYVKSKRSGDRVMESITRYIEKELKLKVNIEKSSVKRPWLLKLLGFTFYHRKGEKGISVHRKSRDAYKEKIRTITASTNGWSMSMRLNQIRQLNMGWGHYFKLGEAKSVFDDLDKWVRSRLRLCYWSQWKRPRTRVNQLEKLGVPSWRAYQWGNTRRGPWRTVHSPILLSAISNAYLKQEGFLSLLDIVKPS
ncbi:group II intron reverse transcriptase/maturase [Fulvivirgaceae bacterium PWU5]|uniref:RNA-directed DNA polymerase n=1 Tax=Dawidia cretensis TaxID=2782350 RepID=A0AAP2GTQ9_9BACT|nr:group II intron reverse transcriptase/maturase [Dawidia cretensis]MBT1712469.1 group II intron reverse transcriptase/maturase [Dawidia cretensis]